MQNEEEDKPLVPVTYWPDISLDDSEDNESLSNVSILNPPQKDNDLVEITDEIDIDVSQLGDKVYGVNLIMKVLTKGCYFSPKYFKINAVDRTIYTNDKSIVLKLNADLTQLNYKQIYFIMSVLQLNILNLLSKRNTEAVLQTVCAYLSLKMELKFKEKTKIAILQHFRNGVEVERISLTLTDAEFESNVNSRIAFLAFGKKYFPDTS